MSWDNPVFPIHSKNSIGFFVQFFWVSLDLQVIVCSLFLIYNHCLIIFFMLFLALYYVTFLCGHKYIFRKISKRKFVHKKLKKPPQKVAYLIKQKFRRFRNFLFTAQQPKWQKTYSKKWPIEQLYIELGQKQNAVHTCYSISTNIGHNFKKVNTQLKGTLRLVYYHYFQSHFIYLGPAMSHSKASRYTASSSKDLDDTHF